MRRYIDDARDSLGSISIRQSQRNRPRTTKILGMCRRSKSPARSALRRRAHRSNLPFNSSILDSSRWSQRLPPCKTGSATAAFAERTFEYVPPDSIVRVCRTDSRDILASLIVAAGTEPSVAAQHSTSPTARERILALYLLDIVRRIEVNQEISRVDSRPCRSRRHGNRDALMT
jgi:hypothetical protein